MKPPKTEDVKRGIAVIWENLQCPICLDLMSMPVSTKCDHQFCRFCMMKLLDRNKKREANCPICKEKITKRSLQDSPGFQRLVEGLKNMVQAFEHDTIQYGYSIEGPWKQEKARSQQGGSREIQSNGEKALTCEGQSTDTTDNSQFQVPEEVVVSLTSSVDVEDGFAKLMGLEDTCTIISHEESLSSDRPASKRKTDGECWPSSFNLETLDPNLKLEESVSAIKTFSHDSSHQLGQSPAEGETSGNKKRKQTHKAEKSPAKILDKRQRRSLDKVSEWLLNITSTDESKGDVDTDGSLLHDSDQYVSNADSSSSTAKESPNEEQPGPRKYERNQCLSDKVFGAVYRRGRRSTVAQLNGCTEVTKSPFGLAMEIRKKTAKRTIAKLTPSDFVRPCSRQEEESTVMEQSEKFKTKVCAFKDKLHDETKEAVDHTLMISLDVKGLKEREFSEEKVDLRNIHLMEVPLQPMAKKVRNNMECTHQEVGENVLQEKEGKFDKANNKLSKSKSKNRKMYFTRKTLAKKTNPPNVRIAEVIMPKQGSPFGVTGIQIENYSSSKDPESQVQMAPRKSRRLQTLTGKAQGSRKKALDNGQVQCARKKASAKKTPVSAGDPLKEETKKGSVDVVDVIDNEESESNLIVNMEAHGGEKLYSAEECSTLSVVPDTESHPEVTIPSLQQVSPPPVGVSITTNLEVHCPDGIASEVVHVELEEDNKNDSELDTEQLLKTFKAIKRRSFFLASPSHVYSENSFPDRQNTGEAQNQKDEYLNKETKPANQLEQSYMEFVALAEMQRDQDSLSLRHGKQSVPKTAEPENSRCSDLIPPLPNLSDHLTREELSQGCKQGHREEKSVLSSDTSNAVSFEDCSDMDIGKNRQSGLSRICSNTIKTNGNKVSANTQDQKPLQAISYQAVSSEPLFSQGSICSRSEMRQNSNSVKPENAGFAVPAEAKDLVIGTHSTRRQTESLVSGVKISLESSMTPDDLLLPNVANSTTPIVASAGLEDSEDGALVQGGTQGSFGLRKPRRPKRLESSESECSGEEDQLPSLAELFRPDRSHPPTLHRPCLQSQDRLLPQKLKCPVELVSGDPGASREADGCNNPALSPGQESIPASQLSVDLFATPDECAPGAGGLYGESSQFSEVLGTQQKAAMQEELHRLEKMMALVAEALQENGGGPTGRAEVPSKSSLHPASAGATGCGFHQMPPCADWPAERPSRSSLPLLPSLITSSGRRPLDLGPDLLHLFEDNGNLATGKADTGPEARVLPSPRAPSPASSLANRAHSRSRDGKLALVASGLSAAELSVLKKFAKKTRNSVSSEVTPETTHIVIKTDGELVCERTLKYFLGIAGRKWVVSFLWVSESFKQRKVLEEAQFEVRGDVANGHNHRGPTRARTTDDHKVSLKSLFTDPAAMWYRCPYMESKAFSMRTCSKEGGPPSVLLALRAWDPHGKLLMRGYEICFQGPFTDMTTGQMEWMVALCGANVVKDPLHFSTENNSTKLVVVQPGSEESQTVYRALQERAIVVSRGWLLDTVATYTLQSPDDYRV